MELTVDELTRRIQKYYTCCLDNDNHVVNKPIQLTCKCSACKECVEMLRIEKETHYYCFRCKFFFLITKHRLGLINFELEKHMKTYSKIIDRFFELDFELLLKDYTKSVQQVKIDDVQYGVDVKINSRIGILENDLQLLADEYKNDVNVTSAYLKETILKNQDNWKKAIEKLRKMIKSRDEANERDLKKLKETNETLNPYLDVIEPLENILKISFEPNSKTMFSQENIGRILTQNNLNYVKINNLIKIDNTTEFKDIYNVNIEIKSIDLIRFNDLKILNNNNFIWMDAFQFFIICNQGSIFVFNKNGKYIDHIQNMDNNSPHLVCLKSYDKIYALSRVNNNNTSILEYTINSNGKLNCTYSYNGFYIDPVHNMKVDFLDPNQHLYLLHDNKVGFFNFSTRKYEKFYEIHNERVVDIDFSHQYIIVLHKNNTMKYFLKGTIDKPTQYYSLDEFESVGALHVNATPNDTKEIIFVGYNNDDKKSSLYAVIRNEQNLTKNISLHLMELEFLPTDIHKLKFFGNKLFYSYDNFVKIIEFGI